jgi:hypothetical protein
MPASSVRGEFVESLTYGALFDVHEALLAACAIRDPQSAIQP